MEAVGPWYITEKSPILGASHCDKPWSRPQDLSTGNKVVDSLNYIQDVLLKRHDLALYQRLEKLEIFPQIYGIRWLRLLFGREFSFRDTLVVWDAILADSCPPSLADQIVVSLLMSVRELLLKYDYPDAVQLLMKLPSNLSVVHIISFALHLKDPLRFAKPTGSAFQQSHSQESPLRAGPKESPRVRNISAPSVFRNKKSQPSNVKTLKMTNLQRSYGSQTPPDLPDFTVVDCEQPEEFEKVESVSKEGSEGGGKVGSETSGGVQEEGTNLEILTKKLKERGVVCSREPTRSKHNSGITAVRCELLNKLSQLTEILSTENLQKRNEVFQHLRSLTDLCNSLPVTEASGSKNCGKMYDFTPSKKQPVFTNQDCKKNSQATLLDQPKPLNRNTSLACDVSTYFDEE